MLSLLDKLGNQYRLTYVNRAGSPASRFLQNFSGGFLEQQLGGYQISLSDALCRSQTQRAHVSFHSIYYRGNCLWLGSRTSLYGILSCTENAQNPHVMFVADKADAKFDRFSIESVVVNPTQTGLSIVEKARHGTSTQQIETISSQDQVHVNFLALDTSRRRIMKCYKRVNAAGIPSIYVDMTAHVNLEEMQLQPHFFSTDPTTGNWWILCIQEEMPYEPILLCLDARSGTRTSANVITKVPIPKAQPYQVWDPDTCQLITPPGWTREKLALRAMNRIQYMVIDKFGRIWLMNQLDHRIHCYHTRKRAWLRMQTRCLDKLNACALATDKFGYIYIADKSNMTVWKFYLDPDLDSKTEPVMCMGPGNVPATLPFVPISMAVDDYCQVYCLSSANQLAILPPWSMILQEQLSLFHILQTALCDNNVVPFVLDFCRKQDDIVIDKTGCAPEHASSRMLAGSMHDFTRTREEEKEFTQRRKAEQDQRQSDWDMWRFCLSDKSFCTYWSERFYNQGTFWHSVNRFQEDQIASVMARFGVTNSESLFL